MAVAVVIVSGAAQATDSGSSNLSVSASISPECNVQQNTAINFNNLSMLNGVAQSSTTDVAAGSIDAICTNGTPSPQFRYTSANGAFQLKGGTDATQLIDYSLFQSSDATGTAVTYGTDMAHPTFTADGSVHTLALSASIAPSAKSGKSMQSYSDTILVTTSFTLP